MAILDLSGSISAISTVSGTIDAKSITAINSADDPKFRIHNLKWQENSPANGFVRWESEDGIHPILVLFGGEAYEITPSQIDYNYLFWRLDKPNEISASNDEPDINGVDVFPLAKNTSGIVDAAWGIRVVDTQKIVNHAVSNLVYSYTAGSLQLEYAVFYAIVWKDIVSTGGDIIIQCSAFFAAEDGDNAINVQVKRSAPGEDNKWFIQTHAPVYVWEDFGVNVAFSIVDDPPAGDTIWTYTFLANCNVDDPNKAYAQKRMITLLELKK